MALLLPPCANSSSLVRRILTIANSETTKNALQKTKTKTKKILAILTLIALVLTMLPFSTSKAAEKPNIKIDSVVTTGQEATVNLTLDQKISTASISTTIKFDKTKLEVINIEVGDIISDRLDVIPGNEESNEYGEVILVASSATNFDIEQGTLLTITFKIKEGVTGKQDLTVILNELYSDDFTDNKDTVTAVSGTIDVKVPVTSIALNKTSGTLNVGQTEDLAVTEILPANTTEDKTVTWTSSDDKIAKVANGTVTAVAPGTATITATVAGVSATYTVEVKQPLTGITLNSASENLVKGQEFDLKVQYVPENSTDKVTVTWESNAPEVANVENGKVTALKEGTAIITATAKVDGTDREYKATCEVNVEEIKLDSIVLNVKDFELFMGDSKQLEVVFNPENTTDSKEVVWTSSDDTVAKVENGKVTALKVGTAVITATVGDKTATVTVTVPAILIEGIEVTLDNAKIEVEGTANLKVTTNPEKVTEEVAVVYESSDETIAKVDENGVITGVNPGKATITVTVNDKFNQEVEIEVVEKQVPVTPEEPTTEPEEPTTTPEEPVTNPEEEQSGENNEEPSVLPDTGDIAIGVFAVLMVASLAGIVLVVRKQQKNK